MRAIVTILNGRYAGRKLWLKPGQRMSFGRTERADFAIPDDGLMSSLHFELECSTQGARLRDLNSANGTLIDSQRIMEAVLRGGEEIHAGGTVFQVEFDESIRASVVAPQVFSPVFSEPPDRSPDSFITERVAGNLGAYPPAEPPNLPLPPLNSSPRTWEDSERDGNPQFEKAVLEVVGRGVKQLHILDAGQHLTVGRTSADICIPEDPLLSGLHFGFSVKRTVVQIEDLRSTNGTFVDGLRIQQATVTGAEVVQAGQTQFFFHLPSESATPVSSESPLQNDEPDDLRGTAVSPRPDLPSESDAPPSNAPDSDGLVMTEYPLPIEPQLIGGPHSLYQGLASDEFDESTDDPQAKADIEQECWQELTEPSNEERAGDGSQDAASVNDFAPDLVDFNPAHEGTGGEIEALQFDASLPSQSESSHELGEVEIVIVQVSRAESTADHTVVRKFWLTPGQSILIGDAADCDEVFSPAAGFASRHFVLSAASTSCTLRDLQSAAGTFVNSQRIEATALRDGDTIQAGAYQFHLEIIRKSV